MTARIFSTARYVFATTMVAALVYAGVESASASEERIGVRSCGWEENPCELAPLVVKAPVVALRTPSPELIAQR